MSKSSADKSSPLPAGPFGEWLHTVRRSQQTGDGVDVRCGDCNACCTSSYFIHIGPSERETLAAIPRALLFPAPGLPKGHMLLGVDEHGSCPMYKASGCIIYEHRPRTCRMYDCRIFPATGLFAEERPRVARTARRWRFSFPGDQDRVMFSALQAAARFLTSNAALFPKNFVPSNAPQQAVLAIKVYDAFVGLEACDIDGKSQSLVVDVLDAYERFESKR